MVEATLAAPGLDHVDMYAVADEPKNAAITHVASESTMRIKATCLDALTRRHGC